MCIRDSDRYDNRTLRENAMLDGNAAALAVLDAINA
jgi:hypothetical protein